MIAKKIFFSILALVAAISSVQAHALWIQTAATGTLGKQQLVKITYAEPGLDPEKLSEWYSDVREFELWLTGPGGEKEKLTTTAAGDHFTSQFTPEKEGIYTLSIGHSAKELGGSTVYQFNASALVKVGNAAAGNDAALNKNELSVFTDVSKPRKVNKPVTLGAHFKGAPGEKIQVTVFSPSGWSRQMESNEKGEVEFTPLWPGTYLIEASKSWKENGTHGGKDYQAVWRAATMLVEVAR